MLSGGGDVAVLAGFAQIERAGTIVPEPSTIALGSIGFFLLAAWRLRRRPAGVEATAIRMNK
jgi:hypothetical protein